MVKLDIHLHTEHSHDSESPVREVILEAKRKGLDGIAITDHNTMKGIGEALEIGKEEGLFIIPGEEICSAEGDILALGIEREIERGLPAKETIDEIHKQGGIAIAAHPYGFIKHHQCVKNLIGELDFDAVEVFNSSNVIENKKAIKRAKELELVAVAGSDAHTVEEVGRSYIVLDCDLNVENVLEKIKKGEISWEGKRTPLLGIVKSCLGLYFPSGKKKPLNKS